MGIHDGHRQRVYDRLRKEGLDSFSPHNVLELLLFFSSPRADTNEIAHRLIDRFGSVAAVLDAPESELVKVNGVGEYSATLIKLIPQLARYVIRFNARLLSQRRQFIPWQSSPQTVHWQSVSLGKQEELGFLL